MKEFLVSLQDILYVDRMGGEKTAFKLGPALNENELTVNLSSIISLKRDLRQR